MPVVIRHSPPDSALKQAMKSDHACDVPEKARENAPMQERSDLSCTDRCLRGISNSANDSQQGDNACACAGTIYANKKINAKILAKSVQKRPEKRFESEKQRCFSGESQN